MRRMKPNRLVFARAGYSKGKESLWIMWKAYYSPSTSRKIDKIMKAFHENKLLTHPIAAGEIDIKKAVAKWK